MTTNSDLNWFVKTSRSLGGNINLVQGAGGNISVKSDNQMIVKSSGIRLSNISRTDGYIIVNHEKISGIYSKNTGEDIANKIIAASTISGSGKPSIETGFHSFLKKYVIHLHPVLLNVILCSTKSRKILSDIFNDTDFLWVPYAKVGHQVSSEIKKRINDQEIIFLENHGIIITSDKPDCCTVVNMVLQRVISYLEGSVKDFLPFVYQNLQNREIGVFTNTSALVARNSNKILKKFLFPDAAVFATSDKISVGENDICYNMNEENARNIDEILSAHAYLHETIEKFTEPKYLTEAEVLELLGMEFEKYRRKLAGL